MALTDHNNIPQEDLIDVFRWCDLPTRCRIRRVSCYWKHVVSLRLVNETVMVDRSCACREAPPTVKCPLYTWENRGEQITKEYVDLPDHRHNGLLGPHVRTIVYRGDNDDTCYERFHGIYGYHKELIRSVRLIGTHCTGLQHLVFIHLGLTYGVRPVIKEHFAPVEDGSSLRQPDCVTVMHSKFLIAVVHLPDRGFYDLAVRVSHWRDSEGTQTDADYVQTILACSGDQRAIISKYASSLPAVYHEWIKNGIYVGRKPGPRDKYARSQRIQTPNFPDIEYQQMDHLLLRILAVCILRERRVVGLPSDDALRLEAMERHNCCFTALQGISGIDFPS